MDLSGFEAVVRILFGVGVMGGVVALAARKVKHDVDELSPVSEMHRVALVRIANVEPDYLVRIAGIATPQKTALKTMLGDRPCVVYQFELFVKGHDVLETHGAGAFYVEDESGRALVEYPCAIIELRERASGTCAGADLPQAVRDWLEEATCSEDWRTGGHLRWVERWIEPGERVCVVGAAKLKIDEEGAVSDYRQSAELMTFETADDAPLSVSDDPVLVAPLPTS